MCLKLAVNVLRGFSKVLYGSLCLFSYQSFAHNSRRDDSNYLWLQEIKNFMFHPRFSWSRKVM